MKERVFQGTQDLLCRSDSFQTVTCLWQKFCFWSNIILLHHITVQITGFLKKKKHVSVTIKKPCQFISKSVYVSVFLHNPDLYDSISCLLFAYELLTMAPVLWNGLPLSWHLSLPRNRMPAEQLACFSLL